jgi:PAS domain S-box-containing protein
MLRRDRRGVAETSTWSFTVRIAIVTATVGAYWFLFAPAYHWISSAAFLLAAIPCVVAGALLGVWGGLSVVIATVAIDSLLASSLGLTGLSVVPTVAVSIFTKLVLGISSGLVAESVKRLRITNDKLAAEVRRRLEGERKLADSEGRYRALVESLGAGVGLYDENGICIFANAALCTALDKDRNDIIGKTFESHLDETSREQIEKSRKMTTKDLPTYEVSLNGKDSWVLLVSETRLTQCDTETGAESRQTLRVVRDISERIASERKQRDLERQLQRGQALQSLAVLAGGVAHDFNNLLSGIVGNAELALRRAPKPSSLELTECLEEIREFASEAGHLSRQMLAYAGRRSLSTKAVDVNVEVREALRLLHSTIEAQAVLRLELTDSLRLVNADRLQLRQVVTNLVLNALESMAPNRGVLTIRTSGVSLDEAELEKMGRPDGIRGGEYVTVSISDNGIGIPKEIKERIFEPFFSTKAPGRGMGLAASLGIVRSHRGHLDVESEPGKGTTFKVLLPWSQHSEQPLKRLTPTDLKAWQSRNILLIDDEAAVRVVTTRLLTELGQKVFTASSGQKGIEIFRQHRDKIDLVLLDLTMPELSGAEVLAELCRLHQDVAVVITSGFHPSNATELLHSPNVKGFLEKPHTLANLEAIVGSV